MVIFSESEKMFLVTLPLNTNVKALYDYEARKPCPEICNENQFPLLLLEQFSIYEHDVY